MRVLLVPVVVALLASGCLPFRPPQPPPAPDMAHVVPRAPSLKAIVFECERNPMATSLPGFARLATLLAA